MGYDSAATRARLLDHVIAEPDLIRLTQWKTLERAEPPEAELASHRTKAAALAGAVGTDPSRGMDILMLALAMAQAWTMTAAPCAPGRPATRPPPRPATATRWFGRPPPSPTPSPCNSRPLHQDHPTSNTLTGLVRHGIPC